MKAKINFTGGNVGEHPNVLKFIGAVVHDDASVYKFINDILSGSNLLSIFKERCCIKLYAWIRDMCKAISMDS